MYAVFQSCGKQYKAIVGQVIQLEKLNFKIGDSIQFKDVLMIAQDKKIKIGTPFVLNSTVKGEIINHGRDKKIKIIKFKRRKHYRKQQGHRQWFTKVKITDINIIEDFKVGT
ncbi:50S ribosomal protein L21 [Candidatus Pantoea edessiphila]|uniref:Large ribosomal subunit protein bL21 n=1 Tax=Candidatus Pantoea edessiphila TaxID=2044610 RepID=A0A2P5SYB3_9GAMM|nr:50S ribosomal protein L21 [Candidatus Pantoea edessiphila]MBK4775647.1 50S ribosomal protein L21 [Pantoea sp. Edef]PPI87293.1 50S ribosomal protein L21 [Candidatus Pantoea edessiphila]